MRPIDIDELRWKLEQWHDDPMSRAAWAKVHGPRLLDALAALRIAAEPFVSEDRMLISFKELAKACRLVKLPEGVGK